MKSRERLHEHIVCAKIIVISPFVKRFFQKCRKNYALNPNNPLPAWLRIVMPFLSRWAYPSLPMKIKREFHAVPFTAKAKKSK